MKNPLLFIALALAAIVPSVFGRENVKTFQSRADQTALLEVFSSEGCSSCPPAEDWLSGFLNSPKLWTEVVPICFHVDYWDYLGWKDFLASPLYSRRQRDYENAGKVKSVYTPGFVLNGREWKGWFQGESLPRDPGKNVGVLSLHQRSGTQFDVEFKPASVNLKKWRVHAVILGMGITSPVSAGENRGKNLRHDFAVLKYTSEPLSQQVNNLVGEIKFSTYEIKQAKSYAVAAWITAVDDERPIQAVGGFLSRAN